MIVTGIFPTGNPVEILIEEWRVDEAVQAFFDIGAISTTVKAE
jgi:hypothetical protein